MFKRIRKPITTKQTMKIVYLLNKTKKFLAIVGMLGIIWSSGPMQYLNVLANDNSSLEQSTTMNEEPNLNDTSNFYESMDVDPSIVPVDFEVISDRTETTKTFRKIDGTYEVALYNDVVHYLENGEYKQVNNSLIDIGDEFENLSNKFKLKFPKKLDDNKQIKLTMDNYGIDWNLLNIDSSDIEYDDTIITPSNIKELVNINQSILYRNVQPNVDIEYILTGSRVKENIILNQYIQDFSMTFEYKLKDLEIIEDVDGNILFVNENNETVFSLLDMFMTDSNENYSDSIGIELIETGNKTYEVIIMPDDEWLRNATYPVMIDPTIESQTTSMSIYDTYISESSPDTNYYSSTFMPVANSSSTSEYRALLYFYIPSTLMDKVITYSNLTLTKSSKTTGRQINLYQNTEVFSSSSATWNNAPSFDTRVIDYHVIDTNDKYNFDITRSVKEWQATGNTRTTGFTITDDEWYGVYNSVKQMEYSTASYRPTITIGYEEPSGLKDYWTYTSQNMGMVGTGYISDYTGNLTWVRDEYSLNNEYMSLTLSFFHNNHTRTSSIGYGDGWRTNYNVQILYDSYSSSYYMLKPDGNRIHFMNESCVTVYSGVQQCTSIAEDGSRMVLERMTYLGDNSSMKVMTIADLDYNFNSDGRLTSIRNTKTNHYLRVYYEDSTSQLIDYVKDEAENRIEFSYSSGRLIKTELQLKQLDASMREVERNYYYYDSYNNLNYMLRAYRYGTDTNTAWSSYERLEYSFDSSNKLIDAYNTTDNFKVQYGYDTQNRVDEVITTDDTFNLGRLDIVYELGKTTYSDFEGDSIYYLFDNYGHTVNVIDDYGNTSFYKYSGLFPNAAGIWETDGDFNIIDSEPNYYNNHNLIESSDVMKQQHNPVINHGFELGTWGWTQYENSGGVIDRDPNHYNIGNQSLYITSTSSTSYSYVSQSVYLEAGSYTVSVWIDNPGSGTGAYVDVTGETSSGTVTKLSNTDGWEKVELSFYISSPRTVTIKLINQSISTANFDNVHLYEGYGYTNCNDESPESCADYSNTRYNVITNSSFESGNSNWTLNGGSYAYINETGIMQDILGEKAMKIIGDGSTRKSITQDLGNLYTSQETYIIAAWAKADAVPNKTYLDFYSLGEAYGDSDGRFFGIELCYFDVTYADTFCKYLTFNPDIEDWQFQMITIDVPSSAMYLSISAIYQGEGTAYFDNIQFYHDKLSTEYFYNANTGDLEQISEEGNTTDYGYDSEHNVTSITEDGVTTNIDRKGTYQVEEVSQNNVRTTFVYNSVTNQLEETYVGYDKDASTQDKWFKTSTTHTSDGQYVNSIKDEFGNVSISNTDYSVGLISEIIDAIGNSQEFIYDEYGNLLSTTITEDGTNDTISSSYEYDSNGRLWKINKDGYVYEFHYNDLDQVEWVKIAGVTAMSYDYWEESEGGVTYYTDLLKKQTYGNNDYVEFAYTEENQIKSISFNGTVRFEYEYDSSGNLAVYKDIYNNNIYFYSYDLVGRLESVVDKDGNTINYTYDSDGNLNGYNYSINGNERGIEYHYNQTTGEYDYTQYEVGTTTITKDYDYDSDSLKRLDVVELLIGTYSFTKTYYYDDSDVDSSMGNATNRVGQITYNNKGTKTYHHYFYDANHNLTEIRIYDDIEWDIIDSYKYHYDGFNQLVREDVKINYGAFKRTYVYEYDNQGNITFIKEHYYTTSSTVSTGQISRKEFSYDNTWGDQLTNYSEYSGTTLVKDIDYTYDNSGNPTYELDGVSGASVEYTWDGRQMTGYYTAEWGNSFKYNDQGIRTQIGSAHKFVLDGDKVIVETIGTTTIYYSYDADGSLLSMNYNGNEYFYITNMQGDVIELVDINGNSVAKYKYDAWGNVIYQTGLMADENPYRYRGYRFDEDTGLYYLQTRYYNPEIGRFISADGLLGPEGIVVGHNNYAYALNNPMNYADRNGDWIHVLCAAVVGAVVASTIQVAYNVINGEDWHENLAGAALGGAVGGALTSVGAGSLAVGIWTGTVTAFGNQVDDVCPDYDCRDFDINNFDVQEFAIDAVTTGVLAGVGSSLGNKAVGYSNKQVGAWFKPQSIKSFVTGGFGKKVTAMILYGSIPSAVPSPANLNMSKVEEKITDLVQYYLRKRLDK